MPRLDEIPRSELRELPLKRASWLHELLKFVEGGIYLLAGEPGIGKTTLALQIGCDLAEQGKKVLYLTSEQSPSDLKSTISRLFGPEGIPEGVRDNLIIEPLLRLEDLELWRSHLVEAEVGEYSNVRLLILDSIQAGGISPAARRPYRDLIRFTTVMKNRGISSLLISHVTKAGLIAGPKDIEHHVDCILQYRKAFKLRPLFVPKNRFGPARLDPFVLEMGERGLTPSPHIAPMGSRIHGFDLSAAVDAEIQVKVQIPKWGERPGLRSPYLPKQKIEQLVDTVCEIPGIDASALTYLIRCYVPGAPTAYEFGLDLAVIVGLLSSYLQREVLGTYGFYGEVDLMGAVRSASEFTEAQAIEEMYNDISSIQPRQGDEGQIAPKILEDERRFMAKLRRITKLFVPEEVREELEGAFNRIAYDTECVGIESIQEIVEELWPDIKE